MNRVPAGGVSRPLWPSVFEVILLFPLWRGHNFFLLFGLEERRRIWAQFLFCVCSGRLDTEHRRVLLLEGRAGAFRQTGRGRDREGQGERGRERERETHFQEYGRTMVAKALTGFAFSMVDCGHRLTCSQCAGPG